MKIFKSPNHVLTITPQVKIISLNRKFSQSHPLNYIMQFLKISICNYLVQFIADLILNCNSIRFSTIFCKKKSCQCVGGLLYIGPRTYYSKNGCFGWKFTKLFSRKLQIFVLICRFIFRKRILSNFFREREEM